MEIDSISERFIGDGGFTSISLRDITPIPVFRSFFTEEILSLITDQTNIYGKQKQRKNSQNKTGRWKDVGIKNIESFFGIIIVMAINDLPDMKLYWSKDNIFHNSFITSIMSRDHFL